MKSRNPKISAFWSWFSNIADRLAADAENAKLLKELDARVHVLHPELSWEIGPGFHKSWQLVISPNLNRRLRTKAREVVSAAPLLTAWEFYSARQPKMWDYKVEIEASGEQRRISLDASAWKYVLLGYPDRTHEILIHATSLPPLTKDERWQVAAIILESILGEELLLDRIDDFALVTRLEPRFAAEEKPLRYLRQAVAGPGDLAERPC